MRWFWIDRFVKFERGRRAEAVKCISLAEEHLLNYAPGLPIMPSSLIVEGMAQTGGMIIGEYGAFEQRVVLAKLGKVVFHFHPVVGDTLTYRAEVQDLKNDGAIVTATSHVGERLQAEAELVFALLDDRFKGVELFEPAGLLHLLRVFKLYEVGRQADGSPLDVPPRLLAAERAVNPPAAQSSRK
jgi:3-hydroxyacyl-[acyl-carrier-protein] dehydratase